MAKITNKKMYRDLMRMDGARMRDLNPMSRAHYAAAVAEPIVKTGAKVAGVVVAGAAIGMGVTACPTNTPDSITCDCPDEATHLEVGANNVNCPADVCPHTGDCTEKVNEMLGNGTTKIVKGVGVDVDAFNTLATNFNGMANNSNEAIKNSFANNVTEIRVVSGSSISHQGKVLSVGIDAEYPDMINYLFDEGLVSMMAQLQPQTKSIWLADKGNKGREWVAKNMKDYAASVADLRNIAYDKANGISI